MTTQALRDHLATTIMHWKLDSHDPPLPFYVYWSTPKGELLYEDWTPDTNAKQARTLVKAATKLGFKLSPSAKSTSSIFLEISKWVKQ